MSSGSGKIKQSELLPKVCYVTAFYDMKRENWQTFSRTFENYLQCFQPIIDLFAIDDQAEMIVYIDSIHYDALEQRTKSYRQIKLIKIDLKFMHDNLPMWKTLDRERQIMNSEQFRTLIPHRLIYPEHTVPEYTLINHCKIDFIGHVIDTKLSLAEYYVWVDFGYCKCPEYTPKRLIDISKLDLERVNYTLVNPIDDRDKSIMYTLLYAPERIGGFFFFGHQKILKQYQELYHKTLALYQQNGLADDDQALVLACYWQQPDLFKLWNLNGWHKALTFFQTDRTPSADEKGHR
jgi:hypothetical protein